MRRMLNDVKQLSCDSCVSSSYIGVVTVVPVMAVVMESIVVREGMGRGDHTGHTKECQKRAHGTRNDVYLGDDFGDR